MTDLAATNAEVLASWCPASSAWCWARAGAPLGVRGATGDADRPAGQVTPAGVVPRLKQMTVAGTFDSGHYEYDSALVLLHHGDAQRIFRLEGPTGVRLKLRTCTRPAMVAQPTGRS